jgi:hypothetical protein
MLLRIAGVGLAATAGSSAGFFLYGGIRSMGETIGFSPSSAGFALIFVAVYGWFFVFAFFVLRRFVRRKATRPWPPWLRTYAVALAIGCAASEIELLVDEAAFQRDVALNPAVAQSRARWWPNGNGGLCYSPERGVWSTD